MTTLARNWVNWRRVHGLVLLVTVALLAPWATLAGAQAPDAVAADPVSVVELERLAATLENEAERTAFLARLRALIAAQRSDGKADGVDGGPPALGALAQRLREEGGPFAGTIEALSRFPELGDWLVRQGTNPEARDAWFRIGVELAGVLLAAWLAARIIAWPLARARASLERGQPRQPWVRAGYAIVRAMLEAVPVAGFAAVVMFGPVLIDALKGSGIAAYHLGLAYVAYRGVVIVARAVLAPDVSSLRIPPLAGETAHYVFLWIKRLAAVGLFGNGLIQTAVGLGLPERAAVGPIQVLGLVITALGVILVLQNRRPVADRIRGRRRDGESSGGGLSVLRERLADVWHVLTIVYLVGVFGVWLLGVRDGFQFLLEATLQSIGAVFVAWIVVRLVRRLLDRGFALGDELKARFPILESRANMYLPVLFGTLRVVVVAVAALAIANAWGVDAFGWLETSAGQKILNAAFSIAAILVLAVLAWELLSSAIETYLNRTDNSGTVIARSARARTLLPLLRNFVLVVLVVMVTLIVLSELGLDIAPLLAGAGVVGLAIGFGSQKLVQDVITGAFLLFEDAIAVGDVVSVAGKAGLVEGLSIRTIRLRDLSGSVHTIPFSAVDTVTNLTKEFSFAVFEVGIAYREDTDAVSDVLREIGAGMQADPELGPLILEPLEVLGVDQFADSAVIIKARIKTLPIRQWTVMREFNRRMKKRFDELGIEIPFPHRTLYFGVDKQGNAPPARMVTEPAADTNTIPPSTTPDSGQTEVP